MPRKNQLDITEKFSLTQFQEYQREMLLKFGDATLRQLVKNKEKTLHYTLDEWYFKFDRFVAQKEAAKVKRLNEARGKETTIMTAGGVDYAEHQK